jgi:hypothetical protein
MMTDNEKEISTIENIIRLLKECLRIQVINQDYDGIIRTIRDIYKCRKSLKRIIEGEKNHG